MSAFTLALIQIILGSFLIICVLLQQRGGGIGILQDVQTQFYSTRRGLEKVIFNLTIILGVLLLALSVISLIIK